MKTLVNLTSRAWSLKILALFAEGVPGRQASLLASTGASRTSFAASLAHLVVLGLVERNPGHGHPLRPEFRLTPAGEAAAPVAARILAAAGDEPDFALLRRTWTVPILALTDRPRRFSGLRTALGPITDRALSTSLAQLEDHDWLRRDIDMSARMPFPTYLSVNKGYQVTSAIGLVP